MARDPCASKTLRIGLRANAAFSAISAVVLLLLSSTLAELFNAPRSVLLGIGVGLVLFVVDLLVTASRQTIPRKKALYFVGADVLWVLGSAVVLLVPTGLTTAGRLAILGVAMVVAGLAAAQYLALPDPGAGRRDASNPEAPARAGS